MFTLGSKLTDLIATIGEHLDFRVLKEVGDTEWAVDVIWFDKRLSFESLGIAKKRLPNYWPVLPVAAFEIEIGTGLDSKHVKGSVSNLDNLGALMGVIVIGGGNILRLGQRALHKGKSQAELEKILMQRVYRWVYTESRPRGRIVTMSEQQVIDLAVHLKVPIPDAESQP